MAGSMSDPERDPRFAGLIALAGALAGVLLWILTIVLSRSHISGNGWALSGNGALIIPFGLGPTVVAGGWAAIILRMRGHPRWLQLGIGSALVGVALVCASILSLIVFGPAHPEQGTTASLFFGCLLYRWLVASARGFVFEQARRYVMARPWERLAGASLYLDLKVGSWHQACVEHVGDGRRSIALLFPGHRNMRDFQREGLAEPPVGTIFLELL